MHVATIEVTLQIEQVFDTNDAASAEVKADEMVGRIQERINSNQFGWLNRLEVVDSNVELSNITTY
ncbi:hypothetical protein [uncultured Veillonella sp.]|jgi:hypothetical protein|uniref:hypothetical protein n=1 Tax=uncultured Veillonella sp. TaxID=159268 RepID=UPI00258C2ADD|nr:hypothetical protein [uncultured Veillonella sp.]